MEGTRSLKELFNSSAEVSTWQTVENRRISTVKVFKSYDGLPDMLNQ